jgi:hypothetical protein
MRPVFSDSHELIVPASRTKLVALALGAAGFVLAGVWMMVIVAKGSVFITMVGAFSVVFFGLLGVYAMRRLIWPTPAVVINREGIWDNASALGVGFIAWDDIARLHEYRFRSQLFLGIVPKDLEAVLANQPLWKRQAIRANLLLGVDPINIPQGILPMTVSELLREVQARFGH